MGILIWKKFTLFPPSNSEKLDSKKIKLLISTDDSEPPLSYSSLDRDEDTVAQSGLKDEQVLFLCLWDDNLGQWENVSVEYPDPYDEAVEDEDEPMDEDDEMNEKNDIDTILEDGKGKAKA
ncbi:hypothetical protein RirG_005150 [Rhizophagus irregularis DAOM 197198w]|uniref:Uncharacterized protein n=1 Tax=Rhizophagus irregularis (strain DAOM 197198w) TaxID=1432141 RepID=A0A015KCF7_RHIIW|nr:hypothetical protein RirG_005150 [Rhizophagus irregularis DAOM 197198w]